MRFYPPICWACRREMRCAKNSVPVRDREVADGLGNVQFPSTVQLADVWRCPACGAEVVVGRGAPLSGETRDHYAAEAVEYAV